MDGLCLWKKLNVVYFFPQMQALHTLSLLCFMHVQPVKGTSINILRLYDNGTKS